METPTLDTREARRDQAVAKLRRLLQRRDVIYLVERRRSRTGWTRIVEFLCVDDGCIHCIGKLLVDAIAPIDADGVTFDLELKGVVVVRATPEYLVDALSLAVFNETGLLSSEWI